MKLHVGVGVVFASLFCLGCGSSGSGAPAYTEDIEVAEPDMSRGGAGPSEVPPPIDECAEDECPVPDGVEWRCRSRFMYGMNLAWVSFGSDFGGRAASGDTGVANRRAVYSAHLADLKAHGVNVVRWWMFPDFRGDGVVFDESGKATGLGDTVRGDVSMALELAQVHDVYLMFTLFSFDGFKPRTDVPYLTRIVHDEALRHALVENVVRPIAAHVEASEYRIRLHSWDLMNEPEWAMRGVSLYGDPVYQNDEETEPVSHGEMETFLADVNLALRQESRALISVGTSLKWPHSWAGLDLDFHQLHFYPWMGNLALEQTPEELGLDDKPVVLGEFPAASAYVGDNPKYDYRGYVKLVREKGWSGSLGWDWNRATAQNKDDVLSYAAEHACETAY
jgi:hypothetical protein